VRPSEHLLGLLPDCDDLLRVAVEGDDGGFIQNHPASLHINERVGRPRSMARSAERSDVKPMGMQFGNDQSVISAGNAAVR